MDMQEIGMLAGVALGGLGLFLVAWRIAVRQRNAARAVAAAKAAATAPEAPAGQPAPHAATLPQPAAAPGPDPLLRRLERRMEEIEAAQADLAERLAAVAEEGSVAKLQAMAGSLLKLLRDKNATMETALAGLDGMRGRLATLESIGDLGEARALLEGLKGRIEALETVQARAADAREAEARAAEARAAEIRGLEAQVAAMGAAAEAREEERRAAEVREAERRAIEARESERRAAEAAGAPNAIAEVAEALARLHAQKEAAVETVFARLGPLEAKLAAIEGRMEGLDPASALARFGERLEAVREGLEARVDAAEAAGAEARAAAAARDAQGKAVAEIAGALAQLHAQKDATAEMVFARLAPLEEKLAELAGRLSGLDPQAAFDRFGERLDAARAALQAQIDALRAEGEAAAENPFAEVSEQLARLYAQKDAAVETVLGRLGPLEARLRELEGQIAGIDPASALDRFGERLAAVQARLADLDAVRERLGALDLVGERLQTLDGIRERLGAVEAAGAASRDAVAAIAAEFARLKERGEVADTALARLGPLEAQLAAMEAWLGERDPGPALARIDERLGALGERVVELEVASREAERPSAALFERVAAMQAEREAALAEVTARLGPLEDRLGAIEGRVAGLDLGAALDRFAERLAAAQAGLQGQIDDLREGNPVADMSAQLTRLYAQKDAAVETVFARLGPLEAKLGEVEARLGAVDPADALGRLDARLAVIGARLAAVEDAEGPYAEITERLTELHARKDAATEAVFARLGPIEAKLDGVEAWIGAMDPGAALARFAERVEASERAQAALAGRMDLMGNPGDALAEIRGEIAGLREQRDAALEAVNARLAGLERALAEVEARGLSEAEARAEAQAIAAQMIATRTVAEETRLFASRLSLLEASLPRLSLSQSLMMQALERHAVSGDAVSRDAVSRDAGLAAQPGPGEPDAGAPARMPALPADAKSGELPDVWRNPRVVSLHQSGS